MSEVDPMTLLEPACARVRDPVSGRSVMLAGLVKAPKLTAGGLAYELHFEGAHTAQDRKGIAAAVEANLRGLGFEGKILVIPVGPPPGQSAPPPAPKRPTEAVPGMSGGGVTPHGGPISKKPVEGVKHIIAVASGKGGVGKSTVSTNLAVALQRLGYGVGLLDADVHGPSVPMMMNVNSKPLVDAEKRILPVMSYGVKCLSMGMLVDPEQAMIWRGPMVMGALRQFLQDARWDGCDYLIVDLPPGTGDAQLSLLQAVDVGGAVIVTTPQDVALADAVRGISMFTKLEVPLLGLIENMAYYALPDGERDYIFGQGGGKRLAARSETELLAEIPLQTAIRKGGDTGLPAALGDGPVAQAFAAVAKRIAEKLPVSR